MAEQTRASVARRPTITTVAKAAGVSIATVSRVMSGSSAVTPDLAARVQKVAEELSYRPSSAARGLVLGSLRNMGVILPDLANAYFFDVVKQMHHGANADGYRMLVADYSGAAAEEYATALDLLGQVDGLILLSSRIPTAGLKELARQSTPVVLVNRIELGVDIPMVAIDNFTPMMELCGHLAQLGHRRVAYIAGSELSWQNRERWRGIEMAKVFGIEAVKIASDGTIEGSFEAIEQALTHEPTALICFNDLSALGAISKLRELGLRVPEDISVTGFDDIAIARHIDPRLTTVVSPKSQLGDQAWALMHAALERNPSAAPPLLAVELVVRDSTGPAK
ncbi:LacI family DNA-binding transcriptional regulator [Rhodococcus sp. LB1]|uniref:LacI family DNA-binding transcriptional regulator n=1 Tax=Rhodococcus sp. LB1 TaxID=1807499 RepID=UPI00077B0465|nr:LacI family DNA-binding transcriptional regulator [Rhodococcus sp. LB1]KXX55940.1 LacI family transcriptional regulator [Rhodococcus sp. LB1]